MRRIALVLLVLCGVQGTACSRVSYEVRLESGFLHFLSRTMRVDPGPDWRGYNLDARQSGFDIGGVFGIKVGQRLVIGPGLGYLNFEGIHGVKGFADVTYRVLTKRFSPVITQKLGYNHIWNQYEGGKGGVLSETGVGLSVRLNDRFDVAAQTGILLQQQALFLPLRLVLRLR